MAVTVNKLYSNSGSLYQMKLIAGHKGLNNLVEWVHIVEDQEVSSFLHGHELIFTAGYMNQSEEWLLEFTRQIHGMQASAFIVNIGPYIKQIPKEVLDFCDEVALPLFTIPWKTRMVDLTRDFCTRIMHNENVENSIATTVKNLLFKTGDPEQQIQQMERYGYMRDSFFCFVEISLQSVQKEYAYENMERLKSYVERVARTSQRLFISFGFQNNLMVLLSEHDFSKIEHFAQELLTSLEKEKERFKVQMGVSPLLQGYENLDGCFEKAQGASEIAKKKEQSICYYEQLDIHKVLLAVKERRVLKEFYEQALGKLQRYDEENNTEYRKFLACYLEHNGSQQQVSDELFIHRNTVNNQVKKIEKITGLNLQNSKDRLQASLCFYIQDLL